MNRHQHYHSCTLTPILSPSRVSPQNEQSLQAKLHSKLTCIRKLNSKLNQYHRREQNIAELEELKLKNEDNIIHIRTISNNLLGSVQHIRLKDTG